MLNERSQSVLAAILFVVSLAFPVFFMEHTLVTGYTDTLAPAYDGRGHLVDNYAVFQKGQYILIRTELFPARIMMKDGKLTRIDSFLRRGGPVQFYRLATKAEASLWNRYF